MILSLLLLLSLIFHFDNGLYVIVFSIVILSLTLNYSKSIKKNQVLIYLVSLLLGISSLFFKELFFLEYVYNGVVGVSFLVVVMFARDLWVGKYRTLMNKTLSIRKELSIIGVLLITPHAFERLFSELSITGIGAYVLLIPLFVTSFHVVRREIDARDWKILHKVSYLAYVLIFMHIILQAEPDNRYAYIFIATSYVVLKFTQLRGGLKNETT